MTRNFPSVEVQSIDYKGRQMMSKCKEKTISAIDLSEAVLWTDNEFNPLSSLVSHSIKVSEARGHSGSTCYLCADRSGLPSSIHFCANDRPALPAS